jgi:hypothetical protein
MNDELAEEHPYIIDMRIRIVDMEFELAEKVLRPSMMLKPEYSLMVISGALYMERTCRTA